MPGSFPLRLRRWLGFEDGAETAPEAGASVTIEQSTGGVDEVKVDLGPDERGAGLLERWTEATNSGEPTSAPPANAPLPEFPEVTIKASRAAIPFDRTIPRVEKEPAPAREVTVTEVHTPSPFPWALVLAAIAMVVIAIGMALLR
jgi:hypothetical protein